MKGVIKVTVLDVQKSMVMLAKSGKTAAQIMAALNMEYAKVEIRKRQKLFADASRALAKNVAPAEAKLKAKAAK
jgi:hypothetical protein